MIHVLVVDDSALMRSEIKKMIETDPNIKVINTARNGQDCIEKISEYPPDVITMDIEMPKMNGLETLEWVVQNANIPVIMVSALTEEGTHSTMKALRAGAFDFIHKPSGTISLDISTQAQNLIQKIHQAVESKSSSRSSVTPSKSTALQMTSSQITRVLVVDDSALMRTEITKMLESDPTIKVIDTAKDGTEVLEKIKQHRPDVMTLDIEMPKMNGLEVLKVVMKIAPLPVVIISALTETNAEETMEALQIGAFDFIHKPSGSLSLQLSTQTKLLVEKIHQANRSRRKYLTNYSKKSNYLPSPLKSLQQQPLLHTPPANLPPAKIVGIGVSTGGPQTLHEILPKLPATLNASLLIAQHMPEKFTTFLAKNLNKVCALEVKEAEQDEIIERGTVYIAPGGQHMSITSRNERIRFIHIEEAKKGDVTSPSVDVLFESLLQVLGANWLGIILTGMGGDGAEGLAKLRNTGGHTIVEDEKSCTIFGMPKRAIAKGAAEFILPVQKIPEKIISLCKL